MVFLAGLFLTLLLFGAGVQRRWRETSKLDAAYLSKLVWVSVGFGMGTGAAALPALWVLISYSIRGGTIESHLPPGANPGFLLGLLVIGTLMTCVYTFIGYRDHVYPYKVIEGQLGGQVADADAQPLQRGPEDLPE